MSDYRLCDDCGLPIVDGHCWCPDIEQTSEQTNASIRAAGEMLKSLVLRLHQLSEDHSHCEDVKHEIGERVSRAESRLGAIRLAFEEQGLECLVEEGRSGPCHTCGRWPDDPADEDDLANCFVRKLQLLLSPAVESPAHEHEWLDISTVEQGPGTSFVCRVDGCGETRVVERQERNG